ncbi:hypothetical protein QBC43DRAFT_296845 [Cladorrhinum sp. PSN259]|nr:hypothetical protein QBC43DRAFT_296845 [Cladorrhinum sp. PSN259]
MLRIKYLLSLVSFVALALAVDPEIVPDSECPVNIPGFTHHGDCNLLCKHASWADVAIFYLGNYVAHAATVNTEPGQSTLNSVFTIISVLLFPGAGVVKGLQAIYSRAVFAPTELQKAARSGALCVVRKIRPSPDSSLGDEMGQESENKGPPVLPSLHAADITAADESATHDIDLEKQGASSRQDKIEPATAAAADDPPLEPQPDQISLVARKFHGICELPKGYCLAILPPDATFTDDPSQEHLDSLRWTERGPVGYITALFKPPPKRTQLSCSYNLVKIAVSVGQLLFACATLYRIQGDQIARFGYAAFGLTVAQYAWMSFINLVGNALRPEYPTMFLVDSASLDSLRVLLEARGQVSKFPISGTVGRISPATEEKLFPTEPEAPETSNRGSADAPVENQPPKRGNPFVDDMTKTDMGSSLATLAGAVPIAIIGGLSRFSPGASELYQRVWTMTWLVFGFTGGPVVAYWFMRAIEQMLHVRHPLRPPWEGDILSANDGVPWPMYDQRQGLLEKVVPINFILALFISLGLYAAPAIGGLVVVGQMIRQYGVCTQM